MFGSNLSLVDSRAGPVVDESRPYGVTFNVMNRNSLIALAALAAALFAVGCSSDTEADTGDESASAVETEGASATNGAEPEVEAEMTLASNAYVNDEGVALCPVRNNEIPEISATTVSREYEGRTYYFC